jgi:catalase
MSGSDRLRQLAAYVSIALIVATLASAFAYAARRFRWPSRNAPSTPAKIVDAFEATAGKHLGFRRNHAKGVCVSGYFDSNGNGAVLSRARVLKSGRTRVTGRFSAAGGDPAEDDAATVVRSFALQFMLDDGQQWRTGMNSAPVFAVRTPQAVYEQLLAMRPDPRTGRPDQQKVRAFYASHPETTTLRDWLAGHPPSSEYYNASYFGINAFRFIDVNGKVRFVRWSVVPDSPYAPVTATRQHEHDPDFLARGLRKRLQSAPTTWHLMLTPAADSDPLDDSTQMWPAERERHRVDAGTIVIEHSEAQIDGACRDINFDPTILPDGIAPSDDPLIAARSATYAESFNRRTREEAAYAWRGR